MVVGNDVDAVLAMYAEHDEHRRLQTESLHPSIGHYARQLPRPAKQKPKGPQKAKNSAAKNVKIPAAKMPGKEDTLHNFTSRRFKAAERLARKQGLSADEVVAARRAAYKQAVLDWYSGNRGG